MQGTCDELRNGNECIHFLYSWSHIRGTVVERGGSSKRHPVIVLQCEWSFSEVHFIVGVRLWRQVVAEFCLFSTRRSHLLFKVISPTFTRFSLQHQRTYMNLYSWESEFYNQNGKKQHLNRNILNSNLQTWWHIHSKTVTDYSTNLFSIDWLKVVNCFNMPV